MIRCLLLLCIVCLLPVSSRAQLKPEEALKTFTVADGLQIELFAAEPMLINPTSIDVDHKGRVWVCEAVNYRRVGFNRPILRPEGDRIVVLEDTTSSGKADKSHVFYQGKEIIAPLGIAVAPYPDGKGQKVFVCQSPDILVFEDKDGDLKADGPPKKLLTGFGGFDHDHGVHGINIGPDGKLYFTVGDQGVKNLQASDGKGRKWTSNTTDCRAGTVWRCDMDGKNLELVAHNFRNNYECCVNSFGEIWLSDNDDDGNQQTRICYVMPGGDYGYNPRGPGQSHWHEEQPGIVHKVLRTGFGSPTGICFYEGTLLPEKYRGQLLHTDAGPREFRCFHIKPKGAGYELEKELLVTSSDTWFRLSDVCVGPDGSVFLADWYDPGVGGHGMGDWTRGRIYRVTPTGHKGYKVPEFDLSTRDGIFDAIRSSCNATKNLGFQLASRMDSTSLIQGFGAVVLREGEKKDPILVARLKWAWQLAHVDSKIAFQDAIEGRLFEDSELLERQLRVRIADELAGFAKATPMLPGGIQFFADARRERLLLLRKFAANEIKDSFYRLASFYDGQDIFYRAALNIACGTDPARRDAILADFDKHFPEWNDKVADLVWELRPKSVLPRLVKLVADPKLTLAQRARIVDILAASEDVSAGQSMLALLGKDSPVEVRDRALENLRLFLPGKWKTLANGKELMPAIDGLLADDTTRIYGLRLIAAVGLVDAVDKVSAVAIKETDAAIKVEAIRTLGRLPTPRGLLVLQGSAQNEPDVAIEAIGAIGMYLSPNPKKGTDISDRALRYLQDIVAEHKSKPEIQRAALSALGGNQTGTQWLIELHEKKQLPENLIADAGKLLRNSPYQGLRNKALLLFPAPGKLDPKKLPPISELAKRAGNAERGKQLLASSLKGETQCLRCHTVRGVGGNLGPDLSMIGKKASKENLFESILLPSKAIADQYLQWQIENAAGQKILGLLIEETPNAVTIRDANGKDTKIAKTDIESRTKSAVSIMPENLVAAMTEDELVDMVAYLFTLKTASLTPESWHIVGPFDNAEDKGLDAVYEPEKAKTIDLGASFKGKLGDVKWKTVRNTGGYVDLMAHYAPKSDNIASYLYQQIESPADQEATIFIGNDDGAKIWLNGEKVFENREHVAATPERNKATVKLKKGVNTVLLKIVNGNGAHGFYLSISSEQELKMAPANRTP